jgi:5'-3' exonuclease
MYQRIALVDVSCLFKRTFEANPNQGATNTLAEIEHIATRVDHVILCLDTPPYARKEIFPDYKAHRDEPTTSETYQKRWLYERLVERGFQMARLKGQEADDVMATLARIYGESIPEVWLVGADKDLAQCVTDNVLQLIPKHGERPEHFRGPPQVKEKFGVTPDQMPLWLALVGDKSDNIPGVKGIGQVKAAGLIGDYKSLTGIAENLRSIPGQVGRALGDGWEQLVLSLKLTTLDTRLPLDAQALLEKKEPKPAEPAPPTAPQGEREFDGFVGNETPMPEPHPDHRVAIAEALHQQAAKPEPLIGKDPRADEFMRQEAAAREQMRNADRAAQEQQDQARLQHVADTVQKSFRREKRDQALETAAYAINPGSMPGSPLAPKSEPAPKAAEAEFDPIGKSPGASGPMQSPGASGPMPPLPPKPTVVPLPGPVKANLRGLALLRAPFEKHQISKLPKGSKEQNNCPPHEKKSCAVCGGWHHPKMIHLDYVGHAALTDRLLEADPMWSWEPAALAPNGLPLFDQTGGLWIRLTVCGVTRLGYGHAPSKTFQEPGAREKEIIGDALRNAAMRFGAALDLWHKGDDLHDENWDATAAWQGAMGGM